METREKVEIYLRGLGELNSAFENVSSEVQQMIQEIQFNCRREYEEHLDRINTSSEKRIAEYQTDYANCIQENEALKQELEKKNRIIERFQTLNPTKVSVRGRKTSTKSSLASLLNK
jgi:hypothetical protein